MLDTDARIAAVNGRAARLRKRREQRVNTVLTASCTVLCLALFGVVELFSGQSTSVSVDGLYGASSLLGTDAGGYIIVSLASFSLAVVITLLCLRRKHPKRSESRGDSTELDDQRKGVER